MKDYIVFFTDGFDKHTIDRQKKVFENAYVSCIDSKPDYNKLVEECKKARENNFSNFYMLWERDDVLSTTNEMKSEFKQFFNETGAIPYKYNKLLENDAAPAGDQKGNTTDKGPAVVINDGQTNREAPEETEYRVDANGNVYEVKVNQGTALINNDNTNGIYNAVYDKNHTATVFIWPFNLFMTESFAKNAWQNFELGVKVDNMSRLPNGSVTSTVNSSKKGNWQRIIYVPQSFKELSQDVARGDTMYNFMNSHLTVYPWNDTKVSKLYIQEIKNRVFGRGGAKIAFGNLTEIDIIRACKENGATNASIRNIHIFYPTIYKNFMKWCPINRCSEMPDVNFPNLELNKKQIAGLNSMKNFIYQYRNLWLDPLTKIYNNTADNGKSEETPKGALLALMRHIPNYKAFFDYWQIYISQRDVYGRPNGKGTSGSGDKFDQTMDSIGAVIDKFQSTEGGRHENDMDEIYKAAGWLPNDMNTATYGKFGGKQLKRDIKNALGNIGIMKKNVDATKELAQTAKANISSKLQSNPSQPQAEEKVEDVYSDEERNALFGDGGTQSSIKGASEKDAEKLKNNNTELDNQNSDNKNEKNTPGDKQAKDGQTGDTEKSEQEKQGENSEETADNQKPSVGAETPLGLSQADYDHLLCFFTPDWEAGAHNWLGHVFFGDEAWAKLENQQNVDSITNKRTKVVRAEIDRLLQANSASGQASDGQSASSTSLPANTKLATGQNTSKSYEDGAAEEESKVNYAGT